MKTVNKKLLAVAVAGVLGMGSVSVMAADGVSANVGFVSNYVWRGVTQTEDKPAVQGGFDWTKGDASVGVWGSSLNGSSVASLPGMELDVYGSYKIGPVTVGAIYYAYPMATAADTYELNVGGDVGPVSLMASYNPDLKGTYLEAGYSFEMTKGISLDLHVGNADQGVGTDYSVGISGSTGGFDLGLTAANSDLTGSTTFVSISKSM